MSTTENKEDEINDCINKNILMFGLIGAAAAATINLNENTTADSLTTEDSKYIITGGIIGGIIGFITGNILCNDYQSVIKENSDGAV